MFFKPIEPGYHRQLIYFRFFYLFLFISFTTHNYLNLYFQELGLSGVQIGIIRSVSAAVMIISQPCWGFICDYTGKRQRVLSFLLLSSGIFFLFFLFGSGYYYFLILIFIYAFFKSPIVPVADSIVLQSLRDRPAEYSRIRLWGAAGLTFSVFLLGFYLEKRGLANLFILYAIFTALALFLSLFFSAPRRKFSPSLSINKWFNLLLKGPFLFFLLGVFSLQTAAFIFDGFFGLFIRDTYGSIFFLGLALTVGGLSEMVVYLLLGREKNSFSPPRLLVISALFSTLRWFLYPLAYSQLHILLIQVLHGLTFGLFYIAGVVYTGLLLPGDLVTTGQTLFWAIAFGISSISGSLLGGFLYDHYGYTVMFIVASFLALLSAGIFLLSRLLRKK